MAARLSQSFDIFSLRDHLIHKKNIEFEVISVKYVQIMHFFLFDFLLHFSDTYLQMPSQMVHFLNRGMSPHLPRHP